MKRRLLILLLCVGLCCPIFTAGASAANRTYTAAEVEDFCGGVISYKASQCGASSAQEWLDTGLCADAGTTAEYYAITLCQSGSYDMSRYKSALLGYRSRNEVYSATTREKYALALLACGSTDEYISRVCDSDIGGLGLMSLIFGLHLLNNGCSSSLYTADSLIGEILGCQLSDGGWAVIGSVGDADVTAMAVQALAPHYGYDNAVTAAVDRALELLSSMQLSSGGYKSMGRENCESAAQVLTALSSLGIDPDTDARFIKGGNTVLSAMLSYRNADGSFAHTGSGFNENATIQAFYSMRAYLRMRCGQSPFYILDRHSASPAEPTASPRATSAQSGGSDNSREPVNDGGRTDASGEKATVSAGTSARIPTEPYHGTYIAPTGDSIFQPTGTAPASAATADEAPTGGGYKLYAVLTVLLIAGVICAVLLIKKKKNIKNYLAVILIAGAAIAVILLTNIESREDYSRLPEKTDAVGTVTMSIRCDSLSDESDRPIYIPDDGVILDNASFTVSEGDTVYDVLLEASKEYGIRIDNRGGEGSAYIAGIQYLYEFDYGSLSGWMYRVNGVFPEVGCQSCILNDGDNIEWLYTKEIGKDL